MWSDCIIATVITISFTNAMESLINSMNEASVEENREYEDLMEGYNSNIQNKNIRTIIHKAFGRYDRYLECIVLPEYLVSKIKTFLKSYKEPITTLFTMMKDIDTIIVKLYEMEQTMQSLEDGMRCL